MDFKTTCEVCGKEYDNYMRTFYVESQGLKTRVCTQCRSKLCQGQHVFTNYIPLFCAGEDLVSHCFSTELQLLRFINSNTKFINSNTKEDYIACMSNDGTIVDVSKNKKFWWVRGFSTLRPGSLPDWEEKVKELYGE